MTKVFAMPFHVKRMDKSIMPLGFSGAYVTCYTTGGNYSEAAEKSLKKLIKDGLYPEEILQPIFEINSADWTQHINEKWSEHVASLPAQDEFEEAVKNGGVVYGPFGSYS